MDHTRDEIRAWLSQIMARTGDTPSSLARRAGLATTTLTRFMNDADAPILSSRTLAKIGHLAGDNDVAPQRPAPAAGGLRADAHPLNDPPAPALALLEAVKAEHPRGAIDPWTLTSSALILAGYLPGDILYVDLNAAPAAGDIVCAQLCDRDVLRAEMLFRRIEPPYLLGAPPPGETVRPLLVDHHVVVVRGVVIATLRTRRG